MFCGKPVIISDLEWSHELLYELDCVCRVDVGNADQLSETIIKIISDPSFSDKIIKNSLHLAHENFDYVANMVKMEKIMLDLVSQD